VTNPASNIEESADTLLLDKGTHFSMVASVLGRRSRHCMVKRDRKLFRVVDWLLANLAKNIRDGCSVIVRKDYVRSGVNCLTSRTGMQPCGFGEGFFGEGIRHHLPPLPFVGTLMPFK
jgi:hypothetical protein